MGPWPEDFLRFQQRFLNWGTKKVQELLLSLAKNPASLYIEQSLECDGVSWQVKILIIL